MFIRTEHASFMLQPGENLLDALERTGHQVDSHCRSGFCGTCRLKLYSGEVVYADAPLAFIGHDEILPCCCEPVTDLVLDTKQPELADPNDLFLFQQPA